MTPEERADRILRYYPVAGRALLRGRIIREIEAALAEAKAEKRREWAGKVRLVHGG